MFREHIRRMRRQSPPRIPIQHPDLSRFTLLRANDATRVTCAPLLARHTSSASRCLARHSGSACAAASPACYAECWRSHATQSSDRARTTVSSSQLSRGSAASRANSQPATRRASRSSTRAKRAIVPCISARRRPLQFSRCCVASNAGSPGAWELSGPRMCHRMRMPALPTRRSRQKAGRSARRVANGWPERLRVLVAVPAKLGARAKENRHQREM
jgi:hypothetical protein